MKFKDIKIGDIVFIEEKVKNNIGISKHFFIPKKVIEVTPENFITSNGLGYKKEGYRITDNLSNAYYKDEYIYRII